MAMGRELLGVGKVDRWPAKSTEGEREGGRERGREGGRERKREGGREERREGGERKRERESF